MQRGDEKGRKLDNWICAAIFIMRIIISPRHQLGLGDNAACNCLCLLNAKDKNESEICSYTALDTPHIYHQFYLVLSHYQPAQLSAQPTHAPTQTSLHCSWKYLLIISEKIDQQIMRSEFMVDKMLQLCQHSWMSQTRSKRETNNVFRLSMNRWGFVWSMLQIQGARKWFPSNNPGISWR